METIEVLRLETRDGWGCFSVHADYTTPALEAGIIEEDGRLYHDRDEFRAPYEEPRLYRRYDRNELDRHVCGFRSIAQARRWFPPCMVDELHRCGLRLTRWHLPKRKVAFGRDQVMFNRDEAELVSVQTVKSLHA